MLPPLLLLDFRNHSLSDISFLEDRVVDWVYDRELFVIDDSHRQHKEVKSDGVNL